MRWLALVAALVTACGPASAPSVRAPTRAKESRAELDRFLADEGRLLALVGSTDPRVAARGAPSDADTIHHAAMAAVLAEDKGFAMEPGPGGADRPDVFSFDARGRALDAAAAILTRWKVPPNNPDPTSTIAPGLELELLGRFVASEKLRLASERALPRSASTLLGAIATTWRPPSDPKEIAPRDEWLAARIEEVSQSLAPKALTALEREELEDALDPLERVVGDSLPKSRAALVELRLAVQRLDPAAKGADRWTEISARLAADTGSRLSPETLLALLTADATALKAEIDKLVGVAITDDVASRAAELLVAPPVACHAADAGSRMRALEPPPERALDCALLARVIAAHTADEDLGVLVAMHDAVVTACRALVFARGGDDEAVALATPKLLATLSPTDEGRLDRFAAVHPVEAIARALSIAWIMRNGLAQAALRANALRDWGDSPLDVIDRELNPQPAGADTFRQLRLH